MVRSEPAGQPHHLDIAPSLTLKPSARRNAIEIAINIYLEQCRRMVAGPPFFQRLNPTKAKLIKRVGSAKTLKMGIPELKSAGLITDTASGEPTLTDKGHKTSV